MIHVKWEATHGYGDVLGGYCHASRLCYNQQTDVLHEWLWYDDREFYPPSEKYKEDPETVLERFYKIKRYVVNEQRVQFKQTHLKFDHDEINDPLGRDRIRYKNRNFGWEATTWKMAHEPRDDGHIAVWTSRKNKVDWRNHPVRFWKHPFPDDWYENFIETTISKTGKKIIHVDYTIPLDEIFDIIRTASFCFGNDGIGNVISKNYWKPIFVTSTNSEMLTKETSGCWSYIIDPKKPSSITNCKNLEALAELQKYEIEEYRSGCY